MKTTTKQKRRRRRPRAKPGGPPILTAGEIDAMRAAGRLASRILDVVSELIAPGVSTAAIDRLVDELTTEAGATSAPYLYQGTFPGHCCTSVNQVVCHGIPADDHILVEGDIINVDVTPVLDGFHGDTSRTFCVGEVNEQARDLVETTFRAMWLGIHAVGPGKHIGDVGRTIQPFAEARGYSIVREFTGHGTGREFHSAPTVFHHTTLGAGIELEPGMAFTIEPMINLGRWKTRVLSDGWTAETIDGKLSAQFEHTIVITPTGVEVFTLGANEKPYRP